jgi:hypothetical protein
MGHPHGRASRWPAAATGTTLARECDVVAYSDSSSAKLAEVRPWYGDVGHRDWHHLLDQSLRLDGVVVLAEHDRMAEVCLAFIDRRAGKAPADSTPLRSAESHTAYVQADPRPSCTSSTTSSSRRSSSGRFSTRWRSPVSNSCRPASCWCQSGGQKAASRAPSRPRSTAAVKW